MRAAQIHDVGGLPAVGDAEEPAGDDGGEGPGGAGQPIDPALSPAGEAVVGLLAAPVTPIALAFSRGILATGHPPLPYVPGCEGVGRTADGRVVWVFGGTLGRTTNGTMGERGQVRGACAL